MSESSKWRWSEREETGSKTDIVRDNTQGITAATPGYLNSLESSLAEVKEQNARLEADRDNPKAPWWNTLDMIRREREEVTQQLAEVKAERERLQRVIEVVSLARDDAEVLQGRWLDGNPDSNTAAQSGPGDDPKRRGVRS